MALERECVMAQGDSVSIRAACLADAAAIAVIYKPYIETSTVTFEEIPLPAEQVLARMEGVLLRGLPWLVAVENDIVLGYAYATPWRERSAYRYSVEVSAYVAPGQVGRGIGQALYEVLLPRLKAMALHTALAVIPLPNPASVALYEKLGFTKVAQLKEVGFKLGRWVDVGYWQLDLEYNRKL